MEVAQARRFARVFAALCLLASTVGCDWPHLPPPPELGAVVENHASEPLATVSLTVAGKSLPDLHDIGVGAEARVTTPNDRGDGVWTIHVRFASGRELSSEDVGYVTNGATMTHHITVTDDAIVSGPVEMVEY